MKKNELSHEELSGLCLELSMLLRAGVSSADALSLLSEEAEDRELLAGLSRQVTGGMPLSAALRENGRFPSYVCGLVQAGEESGQLEEALAALAQYYEDRTRLDRRVRSALLYPAVMLLLMLVIIAVLLMKVLPIFDDVYASLGGRLSGVAGGLLQLGRWLDGIMPVLWVLLALAALFMAAFALLPSFREKVTAFWRRRWGDKGISRKMNDAHVAQALAMVMPTDISLEDALELASGLVDGEASRRCLDCRERMLGGEGTGEAMRSSGLLPARFCRLVELGQLHGSADTAMAKISGILSEESETALEEKVGRVEPALVLVCSILVGLILLSVMLPLMHIMAAIG